MVPIWDPLRSTHSCTNVRRSTLYAEVKDFIHVTIEMTETPQLNALGGCVNSYAKMLKIAL